MLAFTALRTPWATGPGRTPAPTTREIGELFMGRYLLPFEAASILLLAVLIGAIVVARRRHIDDPD